MPAPALSTSLPPGFRYSPRRADAAVRLSRSFYARPTDPAEVPAPAVDAARAKTRLEVLQGWEVSFAVVCLYAAAALALLYILLKLDAVRAAWDASRSVPPLTGPENVFRAALQAASALLPVVFVALLVVHGSPTYEQIWTCVLLAVGLLATNPLTRRTLLTPHASPMVPPEDSRALLWLAAPGGAVAKAAQGRTTHGELIWNDAVYTAVIYLYLLLAAHSYRVFDVHRIHSFAFYAPKLAIAFLYFLVKVITGFKADVSLGLVPFARVLTWFFLVQSGRASLRITIPVMITTFIDTAFGFWLVREVAVTADYLATVSYVENRTKQLGFRCFVYQTLAFCFNMIGLSTLIAYLLPRSFIYSAYDDPHEHFFQLEPPVARLALAFVYFTWTLVLAYVNLPPEPIFPFLQGLVNRCLFAVCSSRVAVWIGLADIVNTEDAEDSSDEDDDAPAQPADSQRSLGAFLHSPILGSKLAIPFRYSHRELFDDVVLSPHFVEPISPLHLNAAASSDFLTYAGLTFDSTGVGSAEEPEPLDLSPEQPPNEPPLALPAVLSAPVKIPPSSASFMASPTRPINVSGTPRRRATDVHYTPDMNRESRIPINLLQSPPTIALDRTSKDRKLRMRKNLFVMETQVLMANAAYLSYIPGNPKEERARVSARMPSLSRSQTPRLHTGSLAHDLDGLARMMDEERISLHPEQPCIQKLQDILPQPGHDDGSMFLVEPYEMAEKYGYKLHKHFSDDETNTHAIVLFNSSRVIVAFSGTRDVTNWGVNANINRVVLDDKLTRFEYELSNGPDSENVGCSDDEADPWCAIEEQLVSRRASLAASDRYQDGYMRRSRSEERLWNVGSACGTSSATPIRPGSSKVPVYGTVEGNSIPARGQQEGRCGEAFGLATQEGVTRVANAFARELLTFGKPKVHEGFIGAYMSLRKQVMGALVELYRGRPNRDVAHRENESELPEGKATSLPLFFTGHSLGGALATFASYEAARYFKRIGLRRRQDISCTTFGCPRLGNEAFKARYERLVETHWRVEIASDPIPNVPITLLNYVHVGVQVLMDQSGMLLIDPSFIEVRWWGLLSNLYLGYRLHIRASYCMAMRTYCKLYKGGCDDLNDRFWPFPIRAQTKGLFHHADR